MSKNDDEMNELQHSLRKELVGRASEEKFGLKKREVSVMTRMSADIVDILDALVELEIFKSRSEAVAALIENAIHSKKRLFSEISGQAADIRKKRDAARHLAVQTIQTLRKEAEEEE